MCTATAIRILESRCAVIVAEICSYVAPRAVAQWERGERGDAHANPHAFTFSISPRKHFCACLLSLPTKDTGTVPGLPPVSFYRWLACLPATSGRRREESQPPRPHPDFRKRVHSTGRNTGVSLGFLVSFPRIQYSYRVRPFIGKVFISTPEDTGPAYTQTVRPMGAWVAV